MRIVLTFEHWNWVPSWWFITIYWQTFIIDRRHTLKWWSWGEEVSDRNIWLLERTHVLNFWMICEFDFSCRHPPCWEIKDSRWPHLFQQRWSAPTVLYRLLTFGLTREWHIAESYQLYLHLIKYLISFIKSVANCCEVTRPPQKCGRVFRT